MTTQAHTTAASGTQSAVHATAQVRTAALVALTIGLFMVFTVGFAYPTVLHNAAHDTRHSMAFPCH